MLDTDGEDELALRILYIDVSDQYQGDEGEAELYCEYPFITTGEVALKDMFWGDERN